jgi:hypothetical protein
MVPMGAGTAQPTPGDASAIAICSAAIARLDARISGSFVSKPWIVRAAWSGYAGALQLQGAEIEEIDVFSRACDLKSPNAMSAPPTLMSSVGSGRGCRRSLRATLSPGAMPFRLQS